MMRTVCPGPTCAWSRTACSAVSAEIGTAAACSNVRFAGFRASLSAPRRHVLGERAAFRDAEDFVARFELRNVCANGFDDAGDAPARVECLRPPKPETCKPNRIGQAGHHMPRASINARRAHPHENLTVPIVGFATSATRSTSSADGPYES